MSKPSAVPYETTHLVRDTCLCLHAQRAARTLARRFDDALRPLGLTNGQFSLLMALNRPEPPTVGAVAALLAMDRTTLTAALKPLVRRGLVKSAPDAQDRRSRRIALTADAHALLSAAVRIWQQTHARIEADLPAGEAERLRRNLGRFSTGTTPGGPPTSRDRSRPPCRP